MNRMRMDSIVEDAASLYDTICRRLLELENAGLKVMQDFKDQKSSLEREVRTLKSKVNELQKENYEKLQMLNPVEDLEEQRRNHEIERSKYEANISRIRSDLHWAQTRNLDLHCENETLKVQLKQLQSQAGVDLSARADFAVDERNRLKQKGSKQLKQENSKLENKINEWQIAANKKFQLEKEIIKTKTKRFKRIENDFKEYREAKRNVICKYKADVRHAKSVAHTFKALYSKLLSEKHYVLETELNQFSASGGSSSEVPIEEQNRLSQEGRKQMESKIISLEIENKILKEKEFLSVGHAAIMLHCKDVVSEMAQRNKDMEVQLQKLKSIENDIDAQQQMMKKPLDHRLTAMTWKPEPLETEEFPDTRSYLSEEMDTLVSGSTSLEQVFRVPSVESHVSNSELMDAPSSAVSNIRENQQSVAVNEISCSVNQSLHMVQQQHTKVPRIMCRLPLEMFICRWQALIKLPRIQTIPVIQENRVDGTAVKNSPATEYECRRCQNKFIQKTDLIDHEKRVNCYNGSISI